MKRLFIAAMMLFTLAAWAAPPKDVTLLVYSGETATTRQVVVNPTDHDVSFPSSNVCDLSGCTTIPGLVLQPGQVARGTFLHPRRGSVGAVHATLPDGDLITYSEVITGGGALAFIEPLDKVPQARYFNLAHAGPYNGWVIVIASYDTVLQYYGTTYQLIADEGVLLAPPPDGVLTIQAQQNLNGTQATGFYSVAGVNSQITGSQQIVKPH